MLRENQARIALAEISKALHEHPSLGFCPTGQLSPPVQKICNEYSERGQLAISLLLTAPSGETEMTQWYPITELTDVLQNLPYECSVALCAINSGVNNRPVYSWFIISTGLKRSLFHRTLATAFSALSWKRLFISAVALFGVGAWVYIRTRNEMGESDSPINGSTLG